MKLNLKFDYKKLKFEKHIIIIVSIIFISIIISFYIYSLVSKTVNKNISSERHLKTLQKKLHSINNYKPTPSPGNIDEIKKDTTYIKNQLWSLKAQIGNPYLNALINFRKKLNQEPVSINNTKTPKKTPDPNTENELNKLAAFLRSWQNFYKANKPKSQDSESTKTVFLNFLIKKGFSKKDYSSSLEIFKQTLQEDCIEELEPIVSEDYLMISLGLPLRVSRIQCKEMITKIEEAINQKLKKNKILSSSQNILLFDEFTTMPNDDQIPYILDYLWFYQDLIQKILNNKLQSFPIHEKLNGLRGINNGDFTILKYKIEIIGTISEVRNFVNSLQNSATVNRLYIIDYIDLDRGIDEAEDLSIPDRKRSLNISIEIGSSDLLKADIKLSYYIYNKPLVDLN